MAFPKFEKDPQAILDYQVDWSDWLDTDTIDASQWIVPEGLTLLTDTNTTTTATAWFSGGTAGTSYNVTNEITTAGGRRDDRTITIKVKER